MAGSFPAIRNSPVIMEPLAAEETYPRHFLARGAPLLAFEDLTTRFDTTRKDRNEPRMAEPTRTQTGLE